MSPLVHRLYIGTLTSIVVFVAIFLMYKGLPYYNTPVEERFYHPDHNWFKPSGIFGHGLGIVGTLLILIGVFGYMARKKYRSLARFGRLKHWLEFHIFLCSLGPVMILFHTAFKFGGLVSVSFWSMVAVVASGVIGRFIYIQIPRTIEGRELSLNEIKSMKSNVDDLLSGNVALNANGQEAILQAITLNEHSGSEGHGLSGIFGQYFEDPKHVRQIREVMRFNNISSGDAARIIKMVRQEMVLNRRIERLQTMRQLFKYWHVAHLPFALIMLIIMVIHVGVTLAFGYRWIF